MIDEPKGRKGIMSMGLDPIRSSKTDIRITQSIASRIRSNVVTNFYKTQLSTFVYSVIEIYANISPKNMP